MIQPVNEFFSTDDFAQEVEYQVVSGSSTGVMINIIYDSTYALDDLRGGVGYQNALPIAICKSSDVSDADTNSCIIMDSVTYHVREIQDDGTGVTLLTLSKDTLNG